jgi:transposase
MHTKTLIKRLLRIDKIAIENIEFESANDEDLLIVRARPMSRDTNRCPKCSKRCNGYDSSNKVRRWRSLDFGSHRVYIEALAPRIECLEHGVLVAQFPWARHDSDYTYDFEAAVTWLTMHTTAQDVANYFRIKWHTVGSIAKRVQKSLEDEKESRFDNP